MGIRFRKSISLGKGVRLNIGKNGISSVTVGKRGGPHVTTGRRGTTVGASIPGTGISYSHKISGKERSRHKKQSTVAKTASIQGNNRKNGNKWGKCAILFGVLCVLCLLGGSPAFLVFAVLTAICAYKSAKTKHDVTGITIDENVKVDDADYAKSGETGSNPISSGARHLTVQGIDVTVDSAGFPVEYVALDLETTGLHCEDDRIVEIGAVKISNGKIAERFQSLVNPGRSMPPVVVNLTGITDSMLENAPTIQDVLPKFLEWVGDMPVVGHNIEFDLGFIESEAARCDAKDSYFVNFDTMQISRSLFPMERKHRLVDLVRRFEIADNEEHRALSDAIQTYQCFEWMRQYVIDSGIKTTSVIDAEENHTNKKTVTHDSVRDHFRAKYYDEHRPEPKNVKPEGKEIANACGCEIVGENQHQETLAKYGIDSWLWVTLRRGSIPKGKNAGQPTIIVNVDGEDVGWLTPLNASKHYIQIPQSGCLAKGRIKKASKSDRLDLRIYLPGPETPSAEYEEALVSSQNSRPVKEADGVETKNRMPHRKDLTGPFPFDVRLNDGAKDVLAEYEDGDWLWVLIRNSETEEPSVLVNISRKRIGVLNGDTALRYSGEIGDSGAMCKAKVTKTETDVRLTAMLSCIS